MRNVVFRPEQNEGLVNFLHRFLGSERTIMTKSAIPHLSQLKNDKCVFTSEEAKTYFQRKNRNPREERRNHFLVDPCLLKPQMLQITYLRCFYDII
jgi:hypothetical protein